MGAETMAVVGLVGAGAQAYGAISGANQQADAARKQADMARMKADESDHQAARDLEVLDATGNQIRGRMVTAVGAAGIDMAGTPLAQLEDLNYQLAMEKNDIEHSRVMRRSMLLSGADMQDQWANDRQTSGYISAGGSILSGAYGVGKGAGWFDKNTKAGA